MAPHSAAKEQHQLANGRFRAGDYAAAAELYGAALHHVPAADLAPEGDLGPAAAASRAYEVTLLSNRAECHLRLGELDPAQRDVERALALDPEHAKSRKRQTRDIPWHGNGIRPKHISVIQNTGPGKKIGVESTAQWIVIGI